MFLFCLLFAAQVYNIYLADLRGFTKGPLKNQDFTPLLKYEAFRSKYLVFQIQCEKILVFQIFDLNYRYFSSKPKIFDRNASFLFEILCFLFEILGVSKICDNCIP